MFILPVDKPSISSSLPSRKRLLILHSPKSGPVSTDVWRLCKEIIYKFTQNRLESTHLVEKPSPSSSRRSLGKLRTLPKSGPVSADIWRLCKEKIYRFTQSRPENIKSVEKPSFSSSLRSQYHFSLLNDQINFVYEQRE